MKYKGSHTKQNECDKYIVKELKDGRIIVVNNPLDVQEETNHLSNTYE